MVDVLILGCGYAGSAVARLARARGQSVVCTVRSPERAAALTSEGFEVQRSPALDASIAAFVEPRTHVVIAFPPDGATDARIAPALRGAHAWTYLSSTGVYGALTGRIADDTALPPADERAARLLAAEDVYRALGGTIFRCPGIYGPDRGLHVRVVRGEHRIPGDGSNMLSRIHVEDLAALVLATCDVHGETFVVGDLAPAPHLEVVRFICDEHGVPLPESIPLERAHPTLRANRTIDPSRALSRLGVTLRYPTYREGMARAATRIPAGAPHV